MGAFLKRNWFQIAIIVMLACAFLKKDLSFQVELNTPSSDEVPREAKEVPARKKTFTQKGEIQKQGDFAAMNLQPAGVPAMVRPHMDVLASIDQEIKMAYLKRFAHVAVSERKKFGIPASIILSNAFLQSEAGQYLPAKKANNHFGIPCSDQWSGNSFPYANQCFRKYDNSWLSFRDHSEYLASGKFRKLFRFGPKNYKEWAKGLEQLGYGSEPDLANQLITIIEQFGLAELDAR